MKKLVLSSVIFGLIIGFGFSVSRAAFVDVPESLDFSTAINYVSSQEIVKGYEDGTFQPKGAINRAEFLKMVIASVEKGFVGAEYAQSCFSDVFKEQWFAPYVCYAKKKGLVKGYEDGSFHPGDRVNISEAAKILANAYDIPVQSGETEQWFRPYLKVLIDKKAIPTTIRYFNQPLKRGEVAELIWRLKEQILTKQTPDFVELTSSACEPLAESVPKNVDLEKVKAAWLKWNNEAREAAGLHDYVYNPQLDRTAIVWSQVAKKRGYITHKRDGQTAYYDYGIMTRWFKNLGLVFENIHGRTHTENINWGRYVCKAGDCTDEMIEDIRSGFDFFMSEKGKAYRPHYDSIMNPDFREIGLGIVVNEAQSRYYLTVHYGTSIISDPPDICEG